MRKRIGKVFDWINERARLRQTRHGGVERLGWSFTLAAAAAYTLVRLPRLPLPVA